MCVYGKDNPEWFKVAVNSIINQTIPPNEIVLVVDGPVPDMLNSVISEFEKLAYFKAIRLETNQGHGNARRIGLEHCSNDLVALMDADDISEPNRFEKQLQLFANDSSLSIVGGVISEFVDNPKESLGKRILPTSDEQIKKYMKKRCPMNQPTVMFKKSDVLEVGGYVDWYCDEDYYLWIRMALANKKFANTNAVLVNMRTTYDSYRRRGGRKYFQSEKKLQKYMRKNKIIGFGTYIANVTERFILQVLMPNKLRGWIFRKFAREK